RRRATHRARHSLNRSERALDFATLTKCRDRNLLNHQTRTFQRGPLTRQFVREKQRVFGHTRKRPQFEVHRVDFDAPVAPRSFGGALDYAQRDGKLVHRFSVRHFSVRWPSRRSMPHGASTVYGPAFMLALDARARISNES